MCVAGDVPERLTCGEKASPKAGIFPQPLALGFEDGGTLTGWRFRQPDF
jgi:hypothetical protein